MVESSLIVGNGIPSEEIKNSFPSNLGDRVHVPM